MTIYKIRAQLAGCEAIWVKNSREDRVLFDKYECASLFETQLERAVKKTHPNAVIQYKIYECKDQRQGLQGEMTVSRWGKTFIAAIAKILTDEMLLETIDCDIANSGSEEVA